MSASIIDAAATKTARMLATRDAIDAGGAAGKLELGTAAMVVVCATITLGYPGAATGTVSGSVLTLAGFPRSDSSVDASGKVTMARIRTSANADVWTMSCGLSAAAAPVWAASTAVAQGATRTNGANIYRCVTAGVTAASGGPAGLGASINDGTAVWAWHCEANAGVQLDSIDLVAGQTVSITSATRTHA